MQDDDFDSGMDVPDDDLAGEPGETDLGDLSGAGDLEADSSEDEQPSHRGSAGARPRSSSGSRKSAQKAKAKAPRKAAKKAARKAGAKKKGAKKAKKGAKKAAPKRKAGRGKK